MLASPAEDAAEIIAPPRARGLGRGQVRRHPRPAPQRGARRAPLLARPPRRQRPVPRGRRRRRGRWRGTGILDGELLAWKDGAGAAVPQLQARLGRKNPSATILADIPVIYVALDAARARPATTDGDATGRAAAAGAAARAAARGSRPSTCRSPTTAAGSPLAPRRGRRRGRPRGRLRRGAGPAQRGADGQGPDEHLLAGPPRPRLAEDEEGARDHRLRRRRRRGRARQAPRRAVATTRSPSATTQTGKLVTIGKAYSGLTDAEIAEMTRWFEAHTIATLRALPAGRADGRRGDRVRRDHALEHRHKSGLRAALPADRRACGPTSRSTRSTRSRRSRALYEGLQHGAEQLVTAGARTVPPAAV